MQLTVFYTWPSAVYNAKELFEEAIKTNLISCENAKLHSFQSHLLDIGITENSKPRGMIIVDLPNEKLGRGRKKQ